MTFVFYSNGISPHQLALAQCLASILGHENYTYVYSGTFSEYYRKVGWYDKIGVRTCHGSFGQDEKVNDLLLGCDVLLSGHRDLALFRARAGLGKHSFYTSERWFKPPIGILRLFDWRYLKMAYNMLSLMRADRVTYLPMGVWAARDMLRLRKLLTGDFRCLFYTPKIDCERVPVGCVEGCDWMRIWGYFVSSGSRPHLKVRRVGAPLRILWAGRMLSWKRVDTLVRAVVAASKEIDVEATIIGDGPESKRIESLAQNLHAPIRFFKRQTLEEVRSAMRRHDIYVLPSNAYEGWGAVVNEALEEGMCVLGTDCAGACATILPSSQRFVCGDWRTLASLFVRYVNLGRESMYLKSNIGEWSVESGARRLIEYIRIRLT